MAITTVIIPVGPRHIDLMDRAVQSAIGQTVPTEVMTFIDRDGRGPAYARNRMVEQVVTPFVTMLDADDYLEPNFVEETLKAWRPGSYVTSDWYHGNRQSIAKARECYPFPSRSGEMSFQLPPSLIPTVFWTRLGGMDEALFGAEDTDFFWRANARMIRSIVVRKPLFTYTGDGYRSREAAQDARWRSLVLEIYNRYKGDYTMGCCGDPAEQSLVSNKNTGEDILVRPTFSAAQLYRGRVTGRTYGRISRSRLVYIDKADMNDRDFKRAEDWEALSPTKAQIEQAAKSGRSTSTSQPTKGQPTIDLKKVDWSDVSQVEQAIHQIGVREWKADNNHDKRGFDIQQTPSELAQLVKVIKDRKVKRVIEIGTGESAGLARFMVEVLGLEVVSIDKTKPTTSLFDHRRWSFIEGDSATVDLPADLKADLVIIDGDHTFDAAKADWERYSKMAPFVVMHDIAPNGWWGDEKSSGGFWRSIAHTKAGNLRKGFHEVIAPLDTANPVGYSGRQGIGYFINE